MNTETLPATTLPTLNGVARLDHLGVIQIEGDDAAKFLHGQLTQDFALLDLNSARLAAFCSAKGRMQASFIGFKRPAGDILLVCSKDLLAPTLKRLSMFVMRAKARLSDASERFAVYGLAGSAIKNIAAGAYSAWAKADFGTETVVNLYPADGTPRQLWVAPADAAAPQGDALALDTWLWSEVRSGVATLSQPVFEAFVPQMLNYESVGGVNFKKGCYPGQEVVARSQFRGTLKRRAFVVQASGPVAAGQEIFAPGDDEQPVGMVVQAAPSPQGSVQAIVSLQLSAVPAGGLHVGAVDLQVQPLPYPLLEDI
ncbi:folate-binding protein [Rhodoferax saidenbachensis]|uniref:Folate-binding protein YgfZ n=1 Tax=Rhodoferax saidenbachensis TaxID=1484693 RepID=A0ABU1ZI90_9BURK|nr:folate-binding protein [Rhodoferax saidenbachensis]MDR7305198.1 folate-binding protein YgfZ [Rhodoferax saidenbachensis]